MSISILLYSYFKTNKKSRFLFCFLVFSFYIHELILIFVQITHSDIFDWESTLFCSWYIIINSDWHIFLSVFHNSWKMFLIFQPCDFLCWKTLNHSDFHLRILKYKVWFLIHHCICFLNLVHLCRIVHSVRWFLSLSLSLGDSLSCESDSTVLNQDILSKSLSSLVE